MSTSELNLCKVLAAARSRGTCEARLFASSFAMSRIALPSLLRCFFPSLWIANIFSLIITHCSSTWHVHVPLAATAATRPRPGLGPTSDLGLGPGFGPGLGELGPGLGPGDGGVGVGGLGPGRGGGRPVQTHNRVKRFQLGQQLRVYACGVGQKLAQLVLSVRAGTYGLGVLAQHPQDQGGQVEELRQDCQQGFGVGDHCG